MRRRRTIFSLPGLILLAILLAALTAFLWRQGRTAFSPGSLSARSTTGGPLEGFASHADFEKECRRCHQPLRTFQAQLCLSCHKQVAAQILTQQGLHSLLDDVVRCYECHADHRGRDFSPLADALDKFDHSVTGFSLIWHQVDYSIRPMACSICHVDAISYSVPMHACTDCHGSQNATFMARHIKDFGENCLDCHDGKDRMMGFDHNQTAFPLVGKHQETSCVACHAGGQFKGLPSACVDCHEEPARHAGLFSLDCASCHDPEAWSPALLDDQKFDHAINAGFSLDRHLKDYSEIPIACATCHPNDLDQFDLSICIDCHTQNDQTFMNEHVAQFGTACLDCHDEVDRMRDFDHNSVFVLDGRHVEIDCLSCHTKDKPANHFEGQCSNCHNTNKWGGAKFNHAAAGATDCLSCHTKDKPSNHFSGQCSNCHNTDKWGGAKFDHAAAGATDCISCHTKDKPANHFSGQCSNCHNTNKWGDATFDHTGQTDCIACHQNDRPKDHFSGQCSQCHNTSNWGDASFDHRFPLDHHGAKGECAKCHPSGGSQWTCYGCHDRQKMEEKHSKEGIGNIDGRCIECHPDGKK